MALLRYLISGLFVIRFSVAGKSEIYDVLQREQPNLPTTRDLREGGGSVSTRRLIVNGAEAEPADYQFFAITASDDYGSTEDNLCGATLVHTDILVTSAHCQGFFNYGVLLYNPATEAFDRRVRIVEQHRHPDFNYNNENLNHDIMVMRLSEPVYDISPAPINDDPNIPANDQRLRSAGFGATEYKGELSAVLMDGDFRYISQETCAQRFRRFGVTGVENGDDLLCVDPGIENGESICLGDSGGPLLTSDGILVGVTSFTFQCRMDEIPDGFARVSFFSEWIKRKICLISIDRPSYCTTEGPEARENEVTMQLKFWYDFFPEDTTFAIRESGSKQIAYVGPTYVVPAREVIASWVSNFALAPGNYIFEVYDKQSNGLGSSSFQTERGFWELFIVAPENPTLNILVASGDHAFFKQSKTPFEVMNYLTVSSSSTSGPTFAPTGSPTRESDETIDMISEMISRASQPQDEKIVITWPPSPAGFGSFSDKDTPASSSFSIRNTGTIAILMLGVYAIVDTNLKLMV